MLMMLPPTTLRVDTLDVMHVTEETAEEIWSTNEQVVISADLAVRGAAQVVAAVYLEIPLIVVLTVEEFQKRTAT